MIETELLYRVYMLDEDSRKLRFGIANKKGNEVKEPDWRTTYISDEIALAKYNLNNPPPYVGNYTNQLDGKPGEVEHIGGPHGRDLVTGYDAKDPAKLPKGSSLLSRSIRNN